MNLMKNSFSSAKKVVTLIQLFIIFVAIGLPVFLKDYIVPAFAQFMIHHAEDETTRVAQRLKHIVIRKEDSESLGMAFNHFSLTNATVAYLNEALKDFQIWKIKIYDHTAKVVYSTLPDEIGMLHTEKYFMDVIAKGQVYSETEYRIYGEGDNIKERFFIESYIPIVVDGKFVGAFEIYYDVTERKEGFDLLMDGIFRTVMFVSGISIFLAIISSVILIRFRAMRDDYEHQLYNLATNDKLTQLLNRHSMESSLQLCINQFQQGKMDYSLLLLDVDHFKSINDTHGHQVGDDVLSTLATLIKDRLRDNDIVGRYGGEEFIAILPNTNASGGRAVAEHLRKMVETTPIKTSAGNIHITISLGVGNFADIDTLSWKNIITKVDEALYKSKHNGRNQVHYVE